MSDCLRVYDSMKDFVDYLDPSYEWKLIEVVGGPSCGCRVAYKGIHIRSWRLGKYEEARKSKERWLHSITLAGTDYEMALSRHSRLLIYRPKRNLDS